MKPEDELELLRHELRLANAEIARLRRRVNEDGSHGKRVQRAYRDALRLATLHVAFLPTTRRFAEQDAGITHVRWENAHALLRLARLHNGRQWLAHDLATIEGKLSNAVEKAMATPEAFRARLPRHARPTGE